MNDRGHLSESPTSEMQTLVGRIRWCAETLRMELPAEKNRRFMEIVEASACRLDEIIERNLSSLIEDLRLSEAEVHLLLHDFRAGTRGIRAFAKYHREGDPMGPREKILEVFCQSSKKMADTLRRLIKKGKVAP